MEDEVKNRVNSDESEGIEQKAADKENDIAISLRQTEQQLKSIHERHFNVITLYVPNIFTFTILRMEIDLRRTAPMVILELRERRKGEMCHEI